MILLDILIALLLGGFIVAMLFILFKNFEQRLRENLKDSLFELNDRVSLKLNDNLTQTHHTFTDVIKRLALIDEAQRRMLELSQQVTSLKELLSDKKSRGAFGEVQLTTLVRNMIPERHFALQATLKNGSRCDCLLYLPKPTGNLVIDAKFPLENYQRLMIENSDSPQRKAIEQAFRRDIKKHIEDIAAKYIIPGETAEGAILFLPAEAIFAEIHANFPDLITLSHQSRVWLASPTTLMAILTTMRSVIQDDATKNEINLVREHLKALKLDVERFQKRMENLGRHLVQMNQDVSEINTSAEKMIDKFEKIERVEME